MKKTLILLSLAAALGACSKKETATTTTPAATTTSTTTVAAPAPTPAPAAVVTPAATTTTTSAADLPSECTSYLDKVTACMNKQPGAGAAMQQAMEQTKASWAAMGANKSALAGACKAATDAFAQQATLMKC